jgi:uncharacterized RDD family membrane protein YckC
LGGSANLSSKPRPLAATPGFFRRLASVLYDALLLVAVLFAATAIALPFNGGKAFSQEQLYYHGYLLLVSFLFYGWFWTHGGQTPGLRAWKIKVLGFDRRPLNWKQAFRRFCAALLSWAAFGIGFFWIALSRNKTAWHDVLSETTIFFEESDAKT